MTVVFDTNVVISAVFWPGEDRHCFAHWGPKRFKIAITQEVLKEYTATAERLAAEYPRVDPGPWLAWIAARSLHVASAPLGKQRSRDAKDDPFLACALASRAEFIVTKDKDLLALGKPFGIQTITPRDFNRRMKG